MDDRQIQRPMFTLSILSSALWALHSDYTTTMEKGQMDCSPGQGRGKMNTFNSVETPGDTDHNPNLSLALPNGRKNKKILMEIWLSRTRWISARVPLGPSIIQLNGYRLSKNNVHYGGTANAGESHLEYRLLIQPSLLSLILATSATVTNGKVNAEEENSYFSDQNK